MLKPSDFHDIDRDSDLGNDKAYAEYDKHMATVYNDASDMISMIAQARRLAEHAHIEGWSVERFEVALDDLLGQDRDEIEQFSEWVGADPFC
jgi:hypothetical protein